MNQTIFFTGGSGLLALNWALVVRERFSVVLGLHERSISLGGTKSLKVDLGSTDQLLHILKAIRPRMVVHTACFTNVDACDAAPDWARHVNVELAANVAAICAELGLTLVHISSDHLFQGIKPLANETQPPAPINIYGQTKAESESRVLGIHPDALVIRTNFYGWGTSYRHSFSDWIIQTLRLGKNITLFDDVFYTPILIKTAVCAIHELIDLGANGIYHVVGDERISKYEFGRRIAREFSLNQDNIVRGHMKDQISLVRRPYDMSLSNEKICNQLNRKLGGVDEDLVRLHHQEQVGIAQELQNL